MTIEVVIERIKSKLAEIQQAGWEKYEANFMVGAHKFEMNPPIAESALLDFEEKYSIQLPEDYREFLLKVGNGGAGPYYGLLPLEKWFIHYRLLDESLEELVEDWHFDPSAHFSKEFLIKPGSEKNDYAYLFELSNQLPTDSPATYHNLISGIIALCNQGCDYYSLLVVNGANKGRVCYACYSGGEDYHYMPDENFLAWYERWLDETLSGKRIGWFGGAGWMGEG